MTPFELEKRLKYLEKKLKCSKEILYSEVALSGEVPCGYKLGYNATTGDIYYKDDNGEWTLAATGGGGGVGPGDTSVAGQIEARVDTNIQLRNTTSSFGSLSGIEDLSTEIVFPDFTDKIILMTLGGTEVPQIDPGDGSLWFTLTGDTITFTNGSLSSGDMLKITIL